MLIGTVPESRYILGLSFDQPGSAACILHEGKVLAAVQEERLSRIPGDPGIPVHAIQYCLSRAGITAKEINLISIYGKPFVRFEDFIYENFSLWPRQARIFSNELRAWLGERLRVKARLRKALPLYSGPIAYIPEAEAFAALFVAFAPEAENEVLIFTRTGSRLKVTLVSVQNGEFELKRECPLNPEQAVDCVRKFKDPERLSLVGSAIPDLPNGVGTRFHENWNHFSAGAIGAAHVAWNKVFLQAILPHSVGDVFLGPSYPNTELRAYLNRVDIPFSSVEPRAIAKKIATGKEVGFFEGALEFGSVSYGSRCKLSTAPGGNKLTFVSKTHHPILFEILKEFRQVAGDQPLFSYFLESEEKPVACTPQNAYQYFRETRLECLVLGECVISPPGGSWQ